MSRVRAMIRKDLLRQIRSPMAILFVLAFPLVFTTVLSLAFGTGSSPSVPRVELLIEDRDGSLVSGALVSMAASDAMNEYFSIRQVDQGGLAMIEAGEASALWRIPEGLQDDLLSQRPVAFELIRNPAQSILPEIAEQGLVVLADILSAAARVLADPLSDVRAMLDADNDPTALQVAELSVAVYGALQRSESILNPPVIAMESAQLTDEEGEGSSGGPTRGALFLFVLPGIAVWGLFLVGDIAMRDVLTEGRLGTLRRQLAGPATASELIVGKALYTAALSGISLVILGGIGYLVGRRAIDAAGFVVLSLALVLAITGFAALTYGGARTERQGGTVSNVLMLVFAFLGGSFFQVSSLPPGVRRFSPLSPFYWGTEGYRALLDGAGVVDIVTHAAVLAIFGALLLTLGSWLLRRRVLGGEA